MNARINQLFQSIPEFRGLVDSFYDNNEYITFGAFGLFISDLIYVYIDGKLSQPLFNSDFEVDISEKFHDKKEIADILRRTFVLINNILNENEDRSTDLIALTVLEKIHDNKYGDDISREFSFLRRF